MHRIVTYSGICFCLGSLLVVTGNVTAACVAVALLAIIMACLILYWLGDRWLSQCKWLPTGIAILLVRGQRLRRLLWFGSVLALIACSLGALYAIAGERSSAKEQAQLIDNGGQHGSRLAVFVIDGPITQGARGGISMPCKVEELYTNQGPIGVSGEVTVWMTLAGRSRTKGARSSTVSAFNERFYTLLDHLVPGERIAAYVRFHRVRQGSFATVLLRRGITVLATGSMYGVNCLAKSDPEMDIYIIQGCFLQFVQRRVQGAYGSSSALLFALAMGDRAGVNRQVVKAFAAIGVIHALIASGATIRMICHPVITTLQKRWRAPTWLWYVAGLFIVGFLVVVSGLAPPALRAAVVVTYELSGKALGRRIDRLTANVFAAVCLNLLEPHLLVDPGVILSFSAVTALAVLPQRICAWWLSWLPVNRLRNVLARGLAADVAVAPLAAFEFGQLSLVSLGMNILLYPALEWLLPVSWVLLLFAVADPGLAQLLCGPIGAGVGGLTSGILVLAAIGKTCTLTAPSLPMLLGYETLVWACILIGRRYTTRAFSKY